MAGRVVTVDVSKYTAYEEDSKVRVTLENLTNEELIVNVRDAEGVITSVTLPPKKYREVIVENRRYQLDFIDEDDENIMSYSERFVDIVVDDCVDVMIENVSL